MEPGDQADVQRSYDALAEAYATQLVDLLASQPVDRSMLGLFAELIADGQVLDCGCGTGEIAAWLHDRGLAVRGIDLSEQMIAQARRRHSQLDFAVGSMTELPDADGSLAGVLAHYSTIHYTDSQLSEAFAEFHRVLRPGGFAMINFQVRSEVKEHTTLGGADVALHYPMRTPDTVERVAGAAGLVRHTLALRAPTHEWETTDQAYLLVQRRR